MPITTFSQTLDALNLKSDAIDDTHAVRLSQLNNKNEALEQSLKKYTDDMKADLIGGELTNDALNTLQEITQALANDEDLAGTITTNIANETTARETADTTLGERITTEATARASALLLETNARQNAVSTLVASVTAEKEARTAADDALGIMITAVKDDRDAADTALGLRITAEREARGAADVAFETSLAAESNARGAADDALQTAVNNKIETNNGYSTGTLTTATLQVGRSSYLYIGDHWRIKANDNGSQLIFEYASDGVGADHPENATWDVAIPFITHTA